MTHWWEKQPVESQDADAAASGRRSVYEMRLTKREPAEVWTPIGEVDPRTGVWRPQGDALERFRVG